MITKEAIEAALNAYYGDDVDHGQMAREQMEAALTAAFAAMPARLTEDQLCGTPFIEELVPLGNEWAACETIQDRYDLLKRRVRASFALATPAAPPLPTLAAENERLRVALEKIKTVASQAHRHRGNVGKEAMFLSVVEQEAKTALERT